MKDIQGKDKYRGERSPYWEYIAGKQGHSGTEEGEQDAQSNPDLLSESDSPYYQNKEAIDTELLQKVKDEIALLSKFEQQVLQMVGYEGRSFDNCASKLWVSKKQVENTINKIRRKFRKKFGTNPLF